MNQPAPVTGYEHEDAWDSGWLRVDSTHELYYEQYGNKTGKPGKHDNNLEKHLSHPLTHRSAHSSPPAIYLHGGPGGHTTKSNTSFFDPSTYRVVLLDQRGCGRSRPNASTKNNTTWHLVSDIEHLRTHLSIPKWHLVFGGSWGSTLALAYAQSHPSSLSTLILRGVFTVRRRELDWSFKQGGASMLFPDAFDELLSFLPEEERGDHVRALHGRLNSEDEAVSLPAARAWNRWEIMTSTLYPNVAGLEQLEDPTYLLAHARIEAHYFTNAAWLEEGQLLEKENVDKIRHIPSKCLTDITFC